MKSSNILDFRKMVDVNMPIIYICNYDFVRVDALIAESVGSAPIEEWTPAAGHVDFLSKVPKTQLPVSLSEFLKKEYLREPPYDDETFQPAKPLPQKFLVLKEIHDQIDDPQVRTLLLQMAQRRLYDPWYNTTVIIVSTQSRVPVELNSYVSFLDIPLADDDEIAELINQHLATNEFSAFKDEDIAELATTLKGMTAFEIDRMLDVAMSQNGSLSADDKDMILRRKKAMVKQAGILELIDAPDRIEDIGGMNTLKKYLERKAEITKNFSQAALYGVGMPKGVFIVGMPGCGKSLCARATANIFDAPLLKMDMGSMMGKYVGESEANLRAGIRIAEAAAPCVLWIDEIEKAFSGVGGHNDIMTRMFGYFLSWMQEKTSSVYIIATANSAENLPAELKRKGRFDEIFKVLLPNEEERKSIFEVHLKKRAKTLALKDVQWQGWLPALAKATAGFNGADIESVINEAAEEAFLSHKPISLQMLADIAKTTKSISSTCPDQIKAMEKIFNTNDFTNAC